MANLSQAKRQRMLEFLQKIKEEHKDDDSILIALGEIESELTAKKYGLVWEQHEEAVDVMMRDNIPVFTEDMDREITCAAGGVYNFILEGDNLQSLRLLEKTQHKLKEEFRDVTAQMSQQMSLMLNPKISTFHIPEQDFFKYDPGVKSEVEYLSNAYHEYTSGFATSLVRSTCEMLFEQYCEKRDDIEWVYKNGDTGQQYFSIVYVDGIQKQWLFYADYIVMKKDGTVWVIETKGGESKGQDKNIDRQIENKFNAFKAYAAQHGLHWGFVRDKDNSLYINNTEFAIDMADEHWQDIATVF
jgi:type III restriction enzyme